MKFCLIVELAEGQTYAAQFEADVTWLPLDAKDSVMTEAVPYRINEVTLDNGKTIFRQTLPRPEDITVLAEAIARAQSDALALT